MPLRTASAWRQITKDETVADGHPSGLQDLDEALAFPQTSHLSICTPMTSSGAAIMEVVLVLLLWAVSATPQVLDQSLSGLETAPDDLCSRDLVAANFCGNKLRSAPPCCSTFHRLYLYRNDIQELAEDWLAQCPNLEELSVSHNALRRLPDHLLSTASSLRRLQASHNHLDSLPPRLLHNATSLQELDLSHNKLMEVPHAFLEKTSHLAELFLQANNLTDLPEDLLANCGSLRALWLSHNRLRRLPKRLLEATPQLRTVRLDHNLIEDIAGDTFDNNPQLGLLDLSSNSLTSLPTGLFRKAMSLRRVLLADNLLSVVPPASSLPQQPAVIDLTYNLVQTAEDLVAFGASSVILEYNSFWCRNNIPSSEISKLDGPQRCRLFRRRPSRYDRPADRVAVTASGLLDGGTPAVAHDATIDFSTTDSATTASVKHETITESPPTSESTNPSTTHIVGSKELNIDGGHVTLDSEYTTSASTVPASQDVGPVTMDQP
ncbi:prolargin-like [Schistocerca gregaria]|uniref:prolargin-like n=1 Tax=Schistocerca gregaria TaxID=7010 RepID=UPI00211EC6BB|nr:prolargin-like [Schistocerca gregaria]